MPSRKVKSLVKLALLLTFIAGAVYYLRFTETGRALDAEKVLDYIGSFNPLAAWLIYVGIYIVGTVLLIPGTFISFAGAVIFGPWLGTLLTWVGATIGAVLSFLVAKVLGRDFVDQLLEGKLAALDRRIRENGFTGVLIMRLLPIFPFVGVNVGCGLSSIRLRDFALATAIGIVPGTFVYQFLFWTVGARVLKEGLKWQDLKDPTLILAVTLFVAFVVAGKWFAGKVQRKNADATQPSSGLGNPVLPSPIEPLLEERLDERR